MQCMCFDSYYNTFSNQPLYQPLDCTQADAAGGGQTPLWLGRHGKISDRRWWLLNQLRFPPPSCTCASFHVNTLCGWLWYFFSMCSSVFVMRRHDTPSVFFFSNPLELEFPSAHPAGSVSPLWLSHPLRDLYLCAAKYLRTGSFGSSYIYAWVLPCLLFLWLKWCKI